MVFQNKKYAQYLLIVNQARTAVLRQLRHISLENLLRSRLDSFVVEIQ